MHLSGLATVTKPPTHFPMSLLQTPDIRVRISLRRLGCGRVRLRPRSACGARCAGALARRLSVPPPLEPPRAALPMRAAARGVAAFGAAACGAAAGAGAARALGAARSRLAAAPAFGAPRPPLVCRPTRRLAPPPLRAVLVVVARAPAADAGGRPGAADSSSVWFAFCLCSFVHEACITVHSIVGSCGREEM